MNYHNPSYSAPGYGQQMQALPVPPNQIISQPLPVAINQPPTVPMVNVPPQIQQYVPLIASVVVMEIQNKMQQNPLRIFMFNLYSRGGYNNQEFAELVEICANYVHLILMHGREYNDPQQAVIGVVPNIVTMMAGAQIKPYQMLMQYLQPDQQQAAINGAKALETVVREIMMHVQGQGQQQRYGQPNQFGGFPTGGYNPMQGGSRVTSMGATSQSSGLFQSPGLQTFNQPSTYQDPGAGASSAAVNRYTKQLQKQHATSAPESHMSTEAYQGYSYQTGATMQPENHVPPPSAVTSHKTAADALAGYGGHVKQPFQAREPAVTEMTGSPSSHGTAELKYETQPEIMDLQPGRWLGSEAPAPSMVSGNEAQDAQLLYTEEQLPAGKKWERSDKQPYHPAWNPRKQKLMYTVLNDGTVLAVLVELSESEKKMMDYKQHTVGVTPVDRPAEPVNKPEGQVVDHILKIEDVKISIEEGTVMVDCERSAYLHALMQVKLGDKLNGLDAYVVRMGVGTPLVCDTDVMAERYRDVLDDLARSRNFADVRRIIGSLDRTSELALRTFLNRLFTEELNSALSLEMGLTGVSIDDFLEDSEPLDHALRGGFGEHVADQLKSQEAYLIARSIDVMDEAESADTSRKLVGDVKGFEDWKGELLYNNTFYTYTHINAFAYELEVANKPGEALVVSEDSSLKLYAIVSKVLEATDHEANEYRRNFLVTSDGVKFEAARGFLNKDALLIRQVPATV